MVQGPLDGAREPIGTVSIRQYGKYFLVKKLAEGGMAEIFLAKQMGVERFEKNVVVKRMLAHLSGVQDFVSMFLDEARLAATLAHPNVVQILDLGLEEGCYFIAMEYLAGEDFSTVIRSAAKRGKYVPLNVVLKVIADAAHGLNFAHEVTDGKGQQLNIVHRDVSPSNIFVTYNGQVKMLDFGIAKAESRVTNTTAGVVKGKYQYMSPEQASSSPVDRRSDVYSLGVCLYEAVTNTRPFARESDLAVLNAVLKNEYRAPHEARPDLPLEVVQIIVKALYPIPESRYQSAAELASDLEQYLRATTSVSNGKALAQYMFEFFGEERVQSKTRIDTLEELKTKAGLVNSAAPTFPEIPVILTGISSSVTKPENGTSTVLPKSIVEWRKKRVSTMAFAVSGALALGVIGTVLALKLWATKPIEHEPVALDAGPAIVTPAPQPPDASLELVPLPVLFDAGSPVAMVVDAGVKKPVVQGPVVLSTAMIVGVVMRNSQAFYRCFDQFDADLPETKGTLDVTFVIASSGHVSAVSSPLSGKSVGKCIDDKMKTLKFPAHVDKQVTATLPLQYNKSRRLGP